MDGDGRFVFVSVFISVSSGLRGGEYKRLKHNEHGCLPTGFALEMIA